MRRRTVTALIFALVLIIPTARAAEPETLDKPSPKATPAGATFTAPAG